MTDGFSGHARRPRCYAPRRSGFPCRAPALRGATKCVKHGRRVQVLDRHHIIRQFINGELEPAGESDAEFRASLPHRIKREAPERLPGLATRSTSRLGAAAREDNAIRDDGYPAWPRFRRRYARVMRAAWHIGGPDGRADGGEVVNVGRWMESLSWGAAVTVLRAFGRDRLHKELEAPVRRGQHQ